MNNKLIPLLLLALPLYAQAEQGDWNIGLAVTVAQSPFTGGKTTRGAKPVLLDTSGFDISAPSLPIMSTPHQQLYVAVGLDEWDYQRGDSAALKGMKALKRAANLRIGGAWKFAPGVMTVDLAKDVVAHKGAQLKVRYTHNPAPHQAALRPYAEVQFLSSALTDYYVGVNANEVRKNRPVYHASTSTALKAGITFEHPLSTALAVVGGLDATHYSAEITGSPLINKSTVWGGYAGLTYRW